MDRGAGLGILYVKSTFNLAPIFAVIETQAKREPSMTTEVFCNEDRKEIKKSKMLCPTSPNLKAGERVVLSAVQDEVWTNGMVLAHYYV